MTTRQAQYRKAAAALATLIALSLITGCGPRQIRGEAPLVKIESLDLLDSGARLGLNVRNLNDVELAVTRVELEIDLEGEHLATIDESRRVSLIATGLETLHFDLATAPPGRALLEMLDTGGRSSLAYRLEGVFHTRDEADLRVEASGRLYRVPGRPGRFR